MRPIRTGGLLVFIKQGWTIDRSEFVKYSDIAPWWYVLELDGLSGKGFLAIDVTAPGGEHLTFIATHLQSQYADPKQPDAKHNWRSIRECQLAQLHQYAQAHSATTILLAGDFNTMPDEPMMQNFKRSWGELTEYARTSCANPCGTHWNNKTKKLSDEWIDYVFVFPVGGATANVDLIRNKKIDDPSDHEGIDAHLTIKTP
jgi:endonuclease/exonuclease/phosphatase family metal-dependent hydrolase